MAHSVLKLTKDQISRLEDTYKSFLQDTVPQGGQFVAKVDGCTITAYRSGKVLFQGATAEQESAKWSGEQVQSRPASEKRKRKTHNHLPPETISSMSIIGSDEVGTGDFFGPITVVSAYVSKQQIPLVQELGVKDSKLLKDPQIIEIAKDLLKVIPFSLMVLHNEKYNELQSKGMTQGKMKAMLHRRAIENVMTKLPEGSVVDGVLIDQFCEPGVYFRHTKTNAKASPVPYFFETKAETIHVSVAAASIIARYAFLKKMDELSKKTGVIIPKGAGQQVDEAAAKIILKQGKTYLNNITKAHFANTTKALKLAEKKRK
ncbi:ribonuclease HIII [Alkalihalobacillus sp. AL-G]|uniref:ribonuclease HIII n=1 Tax=Alkalihalobacillus sp. AL-G TaxID=2926399 RepID=UPI00272BA8EF|nr:ribonuclease HIII [Alkalihalobacillus sp. AL-G]WLD92301.1 ribonuclease HIII [Alkalihalobacillus sp. AL-G]